MDTGIRCAVSCIDSSPFHEYLLIQTIMPFFKHFQDADLKHLQTLLSDVFNLISNPHSSMEGMAHKLISRVRDILGSCSYKPFMHLASTLLDPCLSIVEKCIEGTSGKQ